MDDHIIEILEKSTSKICEIISETGKRHDEALSDNEKRHDEALQRVETRHERTILAAEKRNEDLTKKQHASSIKLTILTVIAGAITFVATMLWNIEANHADALMHQQAVQASVLIQQQAKEMDLVKLKLQQRYHKESILQDQVRELREKIKTYFSLRDQLMMVMANMREVIDYGQEQCVAGKYAGPDPMAYKEKFLRTMYNFVGVIYKTSNIFSTEIYNASSNFINAVPYKNVCGKHAATSYQLRPMQENINKMIVTSISDLRQEKAVKENELQKEENSISNILYHNTLKKHDD